METSSRFLVAAASLSLASVFLVSETPRVGGSGGKRTVTMDCGSGAFIVGATATGGRDGFGFNLVRKIRFTCRHFTGTTATGATTETTEAVADHQGGLNATAGWGNCTAGRVIHSFEVSAATYIDRLTAGDCIDDGAGVTSIAYNVGGEGGDRRFLACPAATEGLFKIEARVGDAIDSMKGYCRPFAVAPPPSVLDQILSSPSPKPTSANPLVVSLRTSKTIAFTITDANAPYSTADVGVSGETDLLGGAGLNLPEFKLELLNPSGTVVASKSFSNVRAIASLHYHFNVHGTWKLRITNLKRDIGSLNITEFVAFAS